MVLAAASDLRQLNIATMMSPVVVHPDFTLHVLVRQHGVVQNDATFRGMALSLLLVIIDAVDVDDPFVVLAGVALNLDDS